MNVRKALPPWLGQVPWLTVGAFSLVVLCAWLRNQVDWLSLVGLVASTFAFYFAGRNIQNQSNRDEILETHATCMRAHVMAQDAIERFAEVSQAYRQLYARHYAMTGEAYRGSGKADPETHDA